MYSLFVEMYRRIYLEMIKQKGGRGSICNRYFKHHFNIHNRKLFRLLRDSLNRFMGLHIPPPPSSSVRPSKHSLTYTQLEATTTTTLLTHSQT
jgi:hypothetical protein